MTVVLDAYAVLAVLKGERAAAPVEDILRTSEARLTALGVAEVMDHLVRLQGADEDEVALDLAQLGLLDAPPLTPEAARGAGVLRARHYHRLSRAVSMADCVVAESARLAGAAVATADPHLLDLCRDEGIEVIELPGN